MSQRHLLGASRQQVRAVGVASRRLENCSFSGRPPKTRRTRRNAQSSISQRTPTQQRTVQEDLSRAQSAFTLLPELRWPHDPCMSPSPPQHTSTSRAHPTHAE